MLKKIAKKKSRPVQKPKAMEEAEESFTELSFKMPKSIAACGDLLYTTRQERIELEHRAQALKSKENKIQDHLIRAIPKDDATGVRGKIAQVVISSTDEPTAENWDKINRYISKYNQFDLLQRRLNNAAIKARWENGKKIPGVGVFKVVKVSCTKL